MSSVASPFGLRPAQHPSGCVRQRAGTIASGYANNIYQHAPIQIDNSEAAPSGTIELAAAGSPALGVFMGVEWTSVDGRRQFSNRWIANTVGTDIVAYFTEDPEIIYEIQAAGSIAQAGIGRMYDWGTNDTNAGNTVTGISDVAMSTTPAAAAATAGLRVIGINPGADNEPGDAFTVVQVKIAEHQYVADQRVQPA